MNKILFFTQLTVVLLVTVFMSACSDDESTPNNIITIGSEKFKLKGEGYAMIFNDEDEGGEFYVHSILLPSSGITVSPTGGITGSGAAVWVELRSNTTTLNPGTYKMDIFLNDVSYFSVVPNFSATSLPDEEFEALSGEVIVSKSGNVYTLTFDFNVYIHFTSTNEEFGDDEIEGNFKGEITVIDNAPTRVGKNGVGFADYYRNRRR